jgi:hypothetical protein
MTAPIFMARLEFAGYTLTACAGSEAAAKRAVLKVVREHEYCENGRVIVRGGETMSVPAFWEYAGGNVQEMAPAKVEWL